MKLSLKYGALFLLGGLAGCDTLGEGNTIKKLEIVPATRVTQIEDFDQGDTYKVAQCLRDELIVLATFTDGSQVNFSRRATWSTSDEAAIRVSNGDIPVVLATNNPADDGSFHESAVVNYGGGTVIPVGAPGETAVVTASFAGLTASINLEIRKPALRIVRLPTDDPLETLDPIPTAEETAQRLAVLVDVGGRVLPLTDTGGVSNSLEINPIRWVLTGATFVPQDDDVSGDIDRWVITDGSDEVITLHTNSTGEGVIVALKAGAQDYEVTAETSLCSASTDAALRPQANVRVGTFHDDPGTAATDERLVLSREPGFNGSGFAPEDLVLLTSHQLAAHASVDVGVDADGDGDPIEQVVFTQQARYIVLPFNASCEDADDLLGCTTNADFTATGGEVRTKAGAAEGDVARVHACYPLCALPTATLEADAASVSAGVSVNFTAAATNPTPGVVPNYLFDFGDGTTLGPQPGANASHAYAAAGAYTATVRVVDPAFPDEFLSQNAGAVRILVDTAPPADNDPPAAVLSVAVTAGEAPLSVALSGEGSADSDSGDAVTVYEFDPGDGSPVIRQTSSILVHVYRDGTGSPFTPTLRVYDESGVASTAVSDATEGAVTVTGTAPADLWSNAVEFRARDAKLCSAELMPDAAAAAAEPAFTFPAMQFQAIGTFVADSTTAACSDPVIGTQLITRTVAWGVRPQGVANEVSTLAGVTNSPDDLRAVGQVQYFANVAADTVLDVIAVLGPPFHNEDVDITPTTLTVQPCAGCTP